jgi:glucosylglycerol phosphorylase (configuration-retaining)
VPVPLRNQVQLICYPDRIGAHLADLGDVLDRHLAHAIGGVHVLPPYPSNADAGFSPLTHREIDPAYGSWDDITRIASRFDLCMDLVLNHISDASPEFLDFLQHGHASGFADLFVGVDTLGEFGPDALEKIHVRKEKEPFREVVFANGERSRVWCTFTEQQIDLDLSSDRTRAMFEETIAFLTARGVKLLRLDAFGYTVKRAGSSCFLVEPDVWQLLEWVAEVARRHGAQCLPEVHDHPSYQYAISLHGLRPYGFALPMLVLDALLTRDAHHLNHWLRMCPRNSVTVLDTHDGICVPDVEGALPAARIQAVVDSVSARSEEPILRGSAADVHSVGAIYQLACTFYDAVRREDEAYIAARAIQLFAPGIPQVYYVGLLAGRNDHELVLRSGERRDVNRHYYSLPEFEQAIAGPLAQRQLRLMEFRCAHPAFDGSFELHSGERHEVILGWRLDRSYCRLHVDLRRREAFVVYLDAESGEENTFDC